MVREPTRGYGAACLAGINRMTDHDVIVFLDADYSNYPGEMARLVDPIVVDQADVRMRASEFVRAEPHTRRLEAHRIYPPPGDV